MADHSGGWMEDQPTSRAAAQDLTRFRGVTVLDPSNTPADLVAHTRSDWYRVEKYYQLDDSARWRDWKGLRDAAGGRDIWLFYACPSSMLKELLKRQQALPYGEFFPRVFGQEAIYLYEQPLPAARAAMRFGLEEEGFLVSCRLAAGGIFQTRRGHPGAAQPPNGYDVVMAPKGTDLGSGPIECDLYAAFNPARILLRYVAHIARARQQ